MEKNIINLSVDFVLPSHNESYRCVIIREITKQCHFIKCFRDSLVYGKWTDVTFTSELSYLAIFCN